MNNNDLRRQVRDCMARAFEMPLADLPQKADVENVSAWDSLGHLMLFEQLEAEFPGKFTQEKFRELLSEDELVAFLEHA